MADKFAEATAAGRPSRRDIGDLLGVGFCVTVAMWAVGYIGRMPGDRIPSPVILAGILAAILAGGLVLGYRGGRGAWGGLFSGFVTGGTNLLILFTLGHHLTSDHRVVDSRLADYAALWGPGFILGCGILQAIGTAVGRRLRPAGSRAYIDGPAAMTRAAVASTVLLICAGGMVTGLNAGLAVPDWPNSFGWNMVFFPLSHMTGGIYFEHAHRLMGTFVGLTTIVMATYLTFADRRAWLKFLAWVAVVMVCVQGALGGLRVIGKSELLAIVHGIFAQIFLATLIALVAFTSRAWRYLPPAAARPWSRTDRRLSAALVALLLVQLVLGALLRHLGIVVAEHIVTAACVLVLVLVVGSRTWGLNHDQPVLKALGTAMMADVVLQILLGILALMVLGGPKAPLHPTLLEAFVTTCHQVNGAALLCLAVLTALFTARLLAPEAASVSPETALEAVA